MTTYVALLRAVNVGGSGKLPMAELRALCSDAGFTDVETYIASGNVVFRSRASASIVTATLERRLTIYAGKPMGVLLRTAAELQAVLEGNPFAKYPGNRCCAFFLDRAASSEALDHATGVTDEQMRLGKREIYVHYPNGMGQSKLRIPEAKTGTARNMNTVAAVAAMASKS
jgi:uncharacterized protein (DUF1697 family)